MSLKVIQGHRKWRYLIGRTLLPNSDLHLISHRFRDLFIAYFTLQTVSCRSSRLIRYLHFRVSHITCMLLSHRQYAWMIIVRFQTIRTLRSCLYSTRCCTFIATSTGYIISNFLIITFTITTTRRVYTFTTTTAGVYAYSLYMCAHARYLSHVYHTHNTQVSML